MQLTTLLLGSILLAIDAAAQVAAPNPTGVSMGHVHIHSRDVAAQRKVWVDGFSAKTVALSKLTVYVIPGLIVFVDDVSASGATPAGTEGSVINHIGLKTPDLKAALARLEGSSITIVSRNDRQAMLLAPDAIRIELTEDKTASAPMESHHVHFYTTDVNATRAWYAQMFGAIPGQRGPFEAADLPGVNLSFSKAESSLAPTKGRALDHIGFEVKDLKSFVDNLTEKGVHFDLAYRKLPDLGIAIAFLTDPCGTRVELTQGLNTLR